MYLSNSWNVITVGDGDLSFSQALLKKCPGIHVCTTVLDSEHQLREKYKDNAIDSLKNAQQSIVYGVDIIRPDSFTNRLQNRFDLAIFQFPLVPNAGPRRPGQSWHQSNDSNLMNRKLLHAFLQNAAKLLLSPEGARLCYITSKDVKPYCDWNIEALGNDHNGQPSPMEYIGQMPFNPNEFPGYRIRNVDRDKQVKSTAAITYVWTDNTNQPLSKTLQKPNFASDEYCQLCGVGPIQTAKDWQAHLNSRLHKRRLNYQLQWENYLAGSNTNNL